MWREWFDWRQGRGPAPQPTANSWTVPAEEIAARGYDLSARNPNRAAGEDLRSPVEITASLLERIREMQEIVESLHEKLSNGDEGWQE
jgi:type I restriction enzyme M protein